MLEFLHHGIRVKALDRNAEVIQSGRLVLEKREKVLTQSRETTVFRLADAGETEEFF